MKLIRSMEYLKKKDSRWMIRVRNAPADSGGGDDFLGGGGGGDVAPPPPPDDDTFE